MYMKMLQDVYEGGIDAATAEKVQKITGKEQAPKFKKGDIIVMSDASAMKYLESELGETIEDPTESQIEAASEARRARHQKPAPKLEAK